MSEEWRQNLADAFGHADCIVEIALAADPGWCSPASPSVKVNGYEAGVVWCDPWRIEIPAGTLRPGLNRLEITVANLWVNRLIGDSALPESQRVTSVPGGNPFKPDTPLQPSSLIGPVSIDVLV